MEICIAVADWARGLMTWVLDVPGGEGTGARPSTRTRRRTRQARTSPVRHMEFRANPSGSTDVYTDGSIGWDRGAGMVVGWG
ncbi:hypothetical protein GCM10009601_56040 [Streptomyces thermospinosisporus]|uniref:Uncharacterized protein n=1 Tax=Streptomyces thermospinosisporus TaxID=161482 RepID=A0ABP4JWQ2_9ACTN